MRLLLLVLLLFLAAPVVAQSIHDVAEHEVALSTVDAAGKRGATALQSAVVGVPFTGVVFQGWSVEGGDVAGWVRFSEGDGWGDWQKLYVTRSATDRFFMAAYRGSFSRSGVRFEVAFEGTVEVTGAGVFDGTDDADLLPTPGVAPMVAATPSDHITPPRLITRAEWGAAAFVGAPSPLTTSTYRYLTFHHAAGFGAVTEAEGKQQMRAIQDFHQNGRGWSDIGYHFLLNEQGDVYQGRPFLTNATRLEEAPVLAMGAHAGGANTGNIGVCILGCYHPPEGPNCQDVIAPAALDSLVTLFAFLADTYGVPPENIFGHRDMGTTATSCPGDNNYVLLDLLRERVRALIETGNQPLGQAALVVTSDEAGVVEVEWTFLAVQDIARYRIVRAVGDVETVVVAGDGAVPDAFVDTSVDAPGDVVYRLYAEGATGREQLLAVASVQVEVPEQYVLAPAFPNPFNPTTTIRYFLEREGIVRLTVFDAAGRAVAALIDGFQEGGRWHAARLDAASLPSGVYFYRLEVEGYSGVDFSATRSLVLVR